MSIALSTSWNAFRHTRGDKLIFEILQLGFKQVELSFNLTAKMVEVIESLAKEKAIAVKSIHNFCPIPAGVPRKRALPDYFSLSSDSQRQRKKAIETTKRTIETAKRLNAKAVVLHCGRVEIPERTKDLIRLFVKYKQKNHPSLKKLREEIIAERRKKEKEFFKNILQSLYLLDRYAQKQGILLGIETRFYYREIPSFSEAKTIFKEFANSQLFYWHDTGHARVRELLGFEEENCYLTNFKDRMLGVHLHNTTSCQDHLAPATGEIDFLSLANFFKKPSIIKVIEAHSLATPEQLKQSKTMLETYLNQ